MKRTPYYDINMIASFLGKNTRYVRSLIKSGRLQAHVVSSYNYKNIIVTRHDFEVFLNSLEDTYGKKCTFE